jgi:hypothetical protein
MAYEQLFEFERKGKPKKIIEIETVVRIMGEIELKRKFKDTSNKLMAELKKMENAGVEKKTTNLGQAQLAGYELLLIGSSLLSYSWEIINDDELKLTLEGQIGHLPQSWRFP